MSPTVTSAQQALLRAGDKDSGSEAAGSDAAKFRLWVRSKGLSLEVPEPELSGLRDDCQEDTPGLFVPTGTDKVREKRGRMSRALLCSVKTNFSDKYFISHSLPRVKLSSAV